MKPSLPLSLLLFILLTACSPSQLGGTTAPDLLPTPSAPVEILPTGVPQTPTDAPLDIPPTDTPQLPTEVVLPLTPTPLPPTPSPAALGSLQVAFINASSDLVVWRETDGSFATLVEAANAIDLRLSDDGTMVAYRRDFDFGQQELWVVNTDGSNHRLLLSVDALAALDPDALGVLIYLYEWIPNTHTLAFNTVEYVEAPGLFLNDDLHFLDTDTGESTTQLTAGTGGNFVFSPDGQQYAVIGQDFDEGVGTISLLNTDGTNLRTDVLTYPYVLTYSEANYYAEPVWSPDSSFLRVAIPPQDALGDLTAPTTLWEIPAAGPALQLGEVVSQPLSPVLFSPDLSHIVYTRLYSPDTDFSTTDLVIAGADGRDEIVYVTGSLSFANWAPDSQHFIFVSNDPQETYLGVVDGDFSRLTDIPFVWNVTWVDGTRYLFSNQAGTGWQMQLGTLGGAPALLVELPDRTPLFDFDN